MAIAASQSPAAASRPIRVMVVDDSAVIRGLIVRTLERDPVIEVTATCSNGLAAVQHLSRKAVDVVILDIEMPIMDGLTALPKLLAVDPEVKIVIASTLSQRNAEISLKALALGATDYLPKPSANKLGASEEFHRELLQKVNSLGRRRRLKPRPAPARSPTPQPAAPSSAPIRLRSASVIAPRVLVIGSSTGGPQALTEFMKALPARVEVPILVAQHMPAAFTPVLAQHLNKACGRTCREAADGEVLTKGHIHVAPGDFHMEIVGEGPQCRLRLTQGPPENFCRPSVNPLLRSAVRAFGAQAVAVILTGMGSDGLEGARQVAAAGGALIAQDEATSVVWGMPGAVATAGLCTAVLPLKAIAPHVAQLFTGARP